MLISPYPDQKGNKLLRQEILSFIYPIYNHNWRNIGTIYIYIYIYKKTRIKLNILTSNKIHREVGRAKDLSAPLYRGVDKSLPDQKGNKQQRQKILMFIYPIYNRNWRNINFVCLFVFGATAPSGPGPPHSRGF